MIDGGGGGELIQNMESKHRLEISLLKWNIEIIAIIYIHIRFGLLVGQTHPPSWNFQGILLRGNIIGSKSCAMLVTAVKLNI